MSGMTEEVPVECTSQEALRTRRNNEYVLQPQTTGLAAGKSYLKTEVHIYT